MSALIEPQAFGSDAPRSWRQYLTRQIAGCIASAFNGAGPLATEIVQAITPLARIETAAGPIFCRAGHGRLVWRAETFYTEEPDTVAWLDSMRPSDTLWDVGANVGLYSLYAAKRGCQVLAFEPESQNYALLMENIALNRLPVIASNVALTDHCGFGKMRVRYITKGGAFNTFGDEDTASSSLAKRDDGVVQMAYGVTGDELIAAGFPRPTHIKIDVDGLEPKIIAGCAKLLNHRGTQSVLVELNTDSRPDLEVPQILRSCGFVEARYGVGKPSTKRTSAMVNKIFERT